MKKFYVLFLVLLACKDLGEKSDLLERGESGKVQENPLLDLILCNLALLHSHKDL